MPTTPHTRLAARADAAERSLPAARSADTADTPASRPTGRPSPARPHAIRRGREILIPSGRVLLVFPRPIDARAYSQRLHRTHFVCQTDEAWRFDEIADVVRVPVEWRCDVEGQR